ncbi:PUA-like domain-containing protein [Irpex rosettiformis]|uniref:PUA-like domain-containing protein n=1 Tax=Irpex rosettiformis TaxID=378272 RepID=A0ACB8TMY5_9APHY|nr:PUA-like domain-containing protein [Irpex rosettiformis]
MSTSDVEHVPVNTHFETRKELADARVHPPLEHGIYRGPGGEDEPAKSIVMANRPEYPNEDHGDRLTYIGMGGRGDDDESDVVDGETAKKRKRARRNTHGGPQTSNQSFDHPMNKALKVAAELGTLVRVTRGAGVSAFAPSLVEGGYRYDGLYHVENPRLEMGPTGKFLRATGQAPLPRPE